MKLRPEVIERELVAAVERCGGLPEAERLALADKLSGAATDHLRRSNELLQLAWRVRFMVARACIMLAILTTLAPAPVQAQDATFRDRAGRTIGTSRTDANDVTTFHDRPHSAARRWHCRSRRVRSRPSRCGGSACCCRRLKPIQRDRRASLRSDRASRN
jgi:hypothetical protein